jgi:hypothetical protein
MHVDSRAVLRGGGGFGKAVLRKAVCFTGAYPHGDPLSGTSRASGVVVTVVRNLGVLITGWELIGQLML